MKLAFYDSGLGGLSILQEFVERFGSGFDYIYYGDSANAPYGSKSPDELISLVYKIFDFMEEKKIDYLISACNTSSALIHKMDLRSYSFPVINLFDLMLDYFSTSVFSETIALLATEATIKSARYLDWPVSIFPLACPNLVPLVESAQMEEAVFEFQNYLLKLPDEINLVLVGCTHYSFLYRELEKDSKISKRYKFIDPAKLMPDYFLDKTLAKRDLTQRTSARLSVELFSSGDHEKFSKLAKNLLIKPTRTFWNEEINNQES
jgi:glutamate racemase